MGTITRTIANNITTGGVITSSGINNSSLSSVTALPAAIATGKVLQVVTATDSTVRTTSSTSFVTASNTLSLSITPSSASNKIFVMATTTFRVSASVVQSFITIYRDATNLGSSDGLSNIYSDSGGAVWTPACISYLDSPSSTSALTYQVYFKTASSDARINQSGVGVITAYEIAG
jgi:hypothetical protein